jgi:hypothetical protein
MAAFLLLQPAPTNNRRITSMDIPCRGENLVNLMLLFFG